MWEAKTKPKIPPCSFFPSLNFTSPLPTPLPCPARWHKASGMGWDQSIIALISFSLLLQLGVLHGLQSFRKNACSHVVSPRAASSVRKAFPRLVFSAGCRGIPEEKSLLKGLQDSSLPSLTLGLARPISSCSSAYHGISLPCST